MHNKANNNYLHTMIFDNSSIKAIHESPFKFVISSSGGGTNAISTLMGVPGASQSILESYVPYSRESLDIHLNKNLIIIVHKQHHFIWHHWHIRKR